MTLLLNLLKFVLDLESPAAIQMFFKINDVMVSFINKQAKFLFSYKLLNLKLIISSFTLFVTRILSSALSHYFLTSASSSLPQASSPDLRSSISQKHA